MLVDNAYLLYTYSFLITPGTMVASKKQFRNHFEWHTVKPNKSERRIQDAILGMSAFIGLVVVFRSRTGS
jgi:hypothetical protein